MYLTKYEKDKLFLYMAGEVAKNRLNKGIRLNQPECVALISCYIMEGAREGKTVSQVITEARKLLKTDQVLDGIPELVNEVLVEATFLDGTKLVSVQNPIPGISKDVPGEYDLCNQDIHLMKSKNRITRKITNVGTRAIQIGSHFHFYEINKNIKFQRENTEGYRLDIPAGSSYRIEPNETKEITLVKIGGLGKIFGFSGKTNKKI